jgi:hypothetical protein
MCKGQIQQKFSACRVRHSSTGEQVSCSPFAHARGRSHTERSKLREARQHDAMPPVMVFVGRQPLISVLPSQLADSRSSRRFDSLPIRTIRPTVTRRRCSKPTVARVHGIPSASQLLNSGCVPYLAAKSEKVSTLATPWTVGPVGDPKRAEFRMVNIAVAQIRPF